MDLNSINKKTNYTSIKDNVLNTVGLNLNTDIAVAQNEPMTNHVLNRNLKKLFDNDLALYELYKKVFNQLNISDYSQNTTYNNGDFVWFIDNDRLYLLKCIADNNKRRPVIYGPPEIEPIDSYLKASGWENKNKYLTIFDYGIEKYLLSLIDEQLNAHQTDKVMHTFGKVSLDSNSSSFIGNYLLKKDISNINPHRNTVFFPQFMQKLDDGYVVLDGYMRNYGKILEYDIIVKMSSSDTIPDTQIFAQSSDIQANTLKLALYVGLTKNSVSYQENDKYFYNSSTLDIFSPTLSSTYTSKIGTLQQTNRNDYVNTYSATIEFPKPFSNRKYMVFTNSILSQTNGTEADENGHKYVVPSQNDIAVCNKTRDSITLLNITFPKQTEFGREGYNAQHGGIIANSFHCKIIGTIGA